MQKVQSLQSRAREREANAWSVRLELQADCLSGVFLGSVRRSLSRTEQDWKSLSDTLRARGDDRDHRAHGTGANRVRWFNRGYLAVSPAACDTWTAAPSQVS